MNQINDLNLLRHHRVDYSARPDTEGARRSRRPNASIGLLMVVTLPCLVVIFPYIL